MSRSSYHLITHTCLVCQDAIDRGGVVGLGCSQHFSFPSACTGLNFPTFLYDFLTYAKQVSVVSFDHVCVSHLLLKCIARSVIGGCLLFSESFLLYQI